MSTTTLVFLVVGIYCAFVTVVGIVANKNSTGTTTDYFLADRKVSAVVSFFTLTATFYSSYLLMGAVGGYYTNGFGMTMAIAYCATYGLWYWVLGGPIHLLGKKFGHSTPADMIGHYYESPKLGALVAIIMCVFTVPYLSMQYSAIGQAFEMLTDGAISYQTGAIILGGICCFYVFLGGFKSVAWTDFAQGAFFMIIAWALGFYFLFKVGDTRGMFENLIAADASMISLPGPTGFYTWGVWLSFMLLYAVLPAIRPDTFQRAYAVKNLKSWKKACTHTTWVLPVTYIITMFTAFGLRLYVPDLQGTASEQALIAFFNLSNPMLGVFILTAAMAASMSTIDSLLLVSSQYLTEDIIKRFMPGRFSDKKLTRMGQIFTVLLTLLAILCTMQEVDFMIVVTALFYGFGCLLWPILGCILWPRGTKAGSLACIVTSCSIITVLKLGGFGTYVGGLHFIAWGVFIGGIVYVAVSLVTTPPSDKSIEEYHGFLRKYFWGKFGGKKLISK